ncbi:hypothetical protein FAI40_04775 [Acetobacteraceae bacterium]|nr:hypothetical protein FAI40_04775 [Acetobacteraceae bacterium]
MIDARLSQLETKIEAYQKQNSERFNRVCENQRRTDQSLQQLLGLFNGIKKAIWGAGALAGTVGGGLFAYFPQFIHFLNHVLNDFPS